MKTLLLMLVALTAESLYAQKVDEYNIPEAVVKCFAEKKLDKAYETSGRINPFYLRGDFDGDGKADYAVLIEEKRTQKAGVAICRSARGPTVILGAGSKFKWGDDFKFDAWQMYGKRRVERGVGEGPPPRLIGEAIMVEWKEKASGVIYWNGALFVWYQQAD